MINYKMKLTDEEVSILEGEKGDTLRKIMESVVLYGDAFGATELVAVEGPVHLVTSFGIPILTPVFDMMEELTNSGFKANKPFTVDPRPIDYDNVKCNPIQKLVFKIMYGKQAEYEEQLKAVGLKDEAAFTCTCYMDEVGNKPKFGEILAWAESSAVVYANSVIGAKTNRNSGVIELLCGILGKAPLFGLLTEEGRQAKWRIELKTSYLPDAQVLGSAIGMKVMEDVPYIKGMDKFLGTELKDTVKDYMKDMGAASASNGAVGLFHVENLTPEAVQKGNKLLQADFKTYIIDDAEIERILSSYPVMWKNKNAKPQICFIGCPHLSLKQIYAWSENIHKALRDKGENKVKLRTIFTAAPKVIDKFKEDKVEYEKLISMGVKLSAICPLMYMNNPVCAKQAVITNSNKLRTYTTARYYTDENILSLIVKGR